MNIIEVTEDGHGFEQRRFFITVPVDVEMFSPEVRRVEIPRHLAKYISDMQKKCLFQETRINELEANIRILERTKKGLFG